MGREFARLDGHWVANLDDTGAPQRRRQRHLIDANTVGQKVNWGIHMRSCVDAERHLRDIADIAAIHIHHALDVYRGLSGQCTMPDLSGTEISIHSSVMRTAPFSVVFLFCRHR